MHSQATLQCHQADSVGCLWKKKDKQFQTHRWALQFSVVSVQVLITRVIVRSLDLFVRRRTLLCDLLVLDTIFSV